MLAKSQKPHLSLTKQGLRGLGKTFCHPKGSLSWTLKRAVWFWNLRRCIVQCLIYCITHYGKRNVPCENAPMVKIWKLFVRALGWEWTFKMRCGCTLPLKTYCCWKTPSYPGIAPCTLLLPPAGQTWNERRKRKFSPYDVVLPLPSGDIGEAAVAAARYHHPKRCRIPLPPTGGACTNFLSKRSLGQEEINSSLLDHIRLILLAKRYEQHQEVN